MALRFPTFAERPDLLERGHDLREVWPEFMLNDPVCNRLFGRVRRELGGLQFFGWDEESDEVVAEGNVIPLAWDGEPATLPDGGVDDVLEAGFAEGRPEPTVLCALQIMVSPSRQGQGLSRRMIERMAELAREQGLRALVAPVRPSRKHVYPLTAIERYVRWRREDGTHVDPWLRTHERLGGEILRVAPRSMTIPGTVAEWEEWAQMAFPESGTYVVPGALVPVEIDLERDSGLYVEPNVWMRHEL